jgi:protein SCO1/2
VRLRSLALCLAALSCAAIASATAPELRAGVFDPPRAAPDFSLAATDGTTLRLGQYRGKVVALSFGYSHCPGVCPATLAYLAQAHKALGDAGRGFQVVYITVDPERDGAKQLREFLAGFDPSFIGGTGTAAQLAKVGQEYGITVSDKIRPKGMAGTDYYLDHSSFIYLIDRAGRLRGMLPFGVTADDIEHDVRVLLGASPAR